MDVKRLNDTLEYVEAHIMQDVDFDKIEQISCLSRYNFQKVFSILAGLSFGEYIRNRRFSHTVYLLKESDMKIIDIAFQIGYESSDAFSASFKKLYGYTPSYLRTHRISLPAFPKLTISLEIRGGYQMNYRVEHLEQFKAAGERKIYGTMEEAQRGIVGFWETFNRSGKSDVLIQLKDNTLDGMLGLCFPRYDGGMEYVIGVSVTQAPSDFETFIVEDGRYLVFDAVGPVPLEIQRVTNEIFQNVLPSSKYELRDAPEFELYHSGDVTSDDYKTEIWIPIK